MRCLAGGLDSFQWLGLYVERHAKIDTTLVGIATIVIIVYSTSGVSVLSDPRLGHAN